MSDEKDAAVDEYYKTIQIDLRCPEWLIRELVGVAEQAGKCQWWNVIGRLNRIDQQAQTEFDKILKNRRDELRP